MSRNSRTPYLLVLVALGLFIGQVAHSAEADTVAAQVAAPAVAALEKTAEKAEAPKAEAKPAEKKAFKGLYEALKESPVRWLPFDDFLTPPKPKTLSEWLVTPPAKKKLIDPLFEPIFLLRASYVASQTYHFTDSAGKKRTQDDFVRNFMGYRTGFVLENFELGFKGRHNESGVYYGGKLELVPREKDGTVEESAFLKEVYAGWNYYSVTDVQVGLIKVPIGQQLQKSTTDMPLIYAPLLDTLLPKRLLGAKLTLSDPYKVLSLQGGVFNTVKQPFEQLTSTKYLLYAARAEFSITNLLTALGVPGERVARAQIGASYAQSQKNYDPRTKLQYRGLDARLDTLFVTVEGEYLVKDYYGEGQEAHLARQGRGWHADLTLHAWPSVLDLTLRYEEADGNTSTKMEYATIGSEAINQKKRWLTAGFMLHVTKQVDIAMNYLHRGEAEGRSLRNDAFITMLQFNL